MEKGSKGLYSGSWAARVTKLLPVFDPSRGVPCFRSTSQFFQLDFQIFWPVHTSMHYESICNCYSAGNLIESLTNLQRIIESCIPQREVTKFPFNYSSWKNKCCHSSSPKNVLLLYAPHSTKFYIYTTTFRTFFFVGMLQHKKMKSSNSLSHGVFILLFPQAASRKFSNSSTASVPVLKLQ